MSDSIHSHSDRWFSHEGPHTDIVVSSRCRLARNLSGLPFARSAQPEQLELISRRIGEAIGQVPQLEGFRRIMLGEITAGERAVLREAHLISSDLERRADHCAVFLSPNAQVSIMINEEDHLRMQAIETGYRVTEAHRSIDEVDDALSDHLAFAFSARLGYLTACPTNTGTGLRASVMLHLPGLVMDGKIEQVIKGVAAQGFAVRGSYGEGTNAAGDLYQISNEITLGKSEQEIIRDLTNVADQLLEHERDARRMLFEDRETYIEDSIWRSYATLSQARMINSSEAISLLSRLRLGIDRGLFNQRLTHHGLNRLLIEIQPAHLSSRTDLDADSDARDALRAELLRERMAEFLN